VAINSGAAIMEDIPPHDPRRSARLQVEIIVNVDHPRSSQRVPAEMTNLSREGCHVVARVPFAEGAQLLIDLPGFEPWPARVIWARAGELGIEWHDPLPATVLVALGERFSRGG
jgi:hypothetical protein